MRDNPTLTKDQIDRIKEVATVRQASSGDVLYEPSDVDVPFFVVLDGIKRVASAVGEGSMAVHLVHRFLADATS
jgi:hypothetical protein